VSNLPSGIYRLIPKPDEPSPHPLEGAEIQLICVLKNSLLWSLRESQVPGAEVEIEVFLTFTEFRIQQRSETRRFHYRWGEDINRGDCPRQRSSQTIDDEQSRLDHALSVVRQELNTLPLASHLTPKSSLRMLLGFEGGRLKSCEISRMRSASSRMR
jgi:hypothetical protein